MIGKLADQKQRNLFNPLLTDFIDMGHELVLLANKIEWRYFEKEFSDFYSIKGQPAVTIRIMVVTTETIPGGRIIILPQI